MTAELPLQFQDVCCRLCSSSMTAELRHCLLPPLEYILDQDVTTAMPLSQEELLHFDEEQQELMTAELRHFVAEDKELDQRTILHLLRLALRGASIPLVDDNGLWIQRCHMCDWVGVKSDAWSSSGNYCPRLLGGCGRRDIVSIVSTRLPPDQKEVSRLRHLLHRDHRSNLPFLNHWLVGGAWCLEGHSTIIGALNLEMISSVSHRNPMFANLIPGVHQADFDRRERERMKDWLPSTVMVRREETAANAAEHSDNSVSRILL